MDVIAYTTHRLVKNEDLNHHGTLYAGRSAEWFVEGGFIAAASLIRPENILCLKIHGMTFTFPVQRGQILRIESKIVCTGRSRLVAYVSMSVRDQMAVEGFITFVHVDEHGQAQPHGIQITPTRPEDLELQEQAKNLK